MDHVKPFKKCSVTYKSFNPSMRFQLGIIKTSATICNLGVFQPCKTLLYFELVYKTERELMTSSEYVLEISSVPGFTTQK